VGKRVVSVSSEVENVRIGEGLSVILDSLRIETTEYTNLLDLLEILGAIYNFDVDLFSSVITCGDHDVEYRSPECPDCVKGLPPRPPGDGYAEEQRVYKSLHDLERLRNV
jgi:hypothetical protein